MEACFISIQLSKSAISFRKSASKYQGDKLFSKLSNLERELSTQLAPRVVVFSQLTSISQPMKLQGMPLSIYKESISLTSLRSSIISSSYLPTVTALTMLLTWLRRKNSCYARVSLPMQWVPTNSLTIILKTSPTYWLKRTISWL